MATMMAKSGMDSWTGIRVLLGIRRMVTSGVGSWDLTCAIR